MTLALPICGSLDCLSCVRKTQAHLRVRQGQGTTYWSSIGLAPPTPAQVLKHETKFGTDAPKRQRRSGPSVKSQVLELHSRGVVPDAIADTLNVSDRRVRSILAAAPA